MALRIVVTAFAICAVSIEAVAQEGIDDSRRNALVRAIEGVSPAVVTINAVQIQRQRVFDPVFRDFWDFFEAPLLRPRIRERRYQSVGSGFLIDNRGYIITNAHVLDGAHEVWVTLPDGRDVEVALVGKDSRSDIAVLRTSERGLPYAPLGDSSDLLVGEWAIAIGNPFGMMMDDPKPSVSVGVISANHRLVSREIAGGERFYQDLVQTDAAINPGNSGGPLVNAKGEVIGVNTIIFSQSGGSVGIGFAIPINQAQRVAREIIEYGRRRDPWAGFKVEALRDIHSGFLRQLGVRVEHGCLVVGILENSPAYRAGLRQGDVIVAIDGEEVHDPVDIDFIMWRHFVGDQVGMTIDRGGRRRQLTFTVEELNR